MPFDTSDPPRITAIPARPDENGGQRCATSPEIRASMTEFPKTVRSAMIRMIMEMGKLGLHPISVGLSDLQFRALANQMGIHNPNTETLALEVCARKVTFYVDQRGG